MYIHDAIRSLAATRSIAATAASVGVPAHVLMARLRDMTPDESMELSDALSGSGSVLSA